MRIMRRFLLPFALLAAVLIAAPGPKATPVTNPLTADIDAAGHSILNVATLTAAGNITAQANIQTSGYFVGQSLVSMGGTMILEPADTSVIAITSGRNAPTVTCPAGVNAGSLYVQGYPTPALWQLIAGPCDWQRIAP